MDAAKPVRLLSVASAAAPYELLQADAAEAAARLFRPDFPAFDRMAQVFQTAGIDTRQLVRPMEWYLQARDWPQRMAAFADGAVELFVGAASHALADAELRADQVDIIVTVCSTGIATPSLEVRAMTRMGFRSDAVRVPVFGLGCAGGASGLALAARLARSQPDANVLLVCVEVCSTAFRTEAISKADVVATALFGDGSAACVLRTGEHGFAEITASSEHTWPDTLDVMGWRIDPTGLGVVFAQSIPKVVRQRLRPVVDKALSEQRLTVSDVGRFICHPGGMKVMQALEEVLDLPDGALDAEREVLAAHGNMSSPTVLQVLDRIRRTGVPSQALLMALGPGFTASTVLLSA